MVTETRVAITVATYKRNDKLLDLIESIADSGGDVAREIVVVDNDPAGGARSVVPDGVIYIHQPTPGIVAARNTGLEWVYRQRGLTHLAFVDDDETVGALWLDLLVETMSNAAADVVSGPVVPLYPLGMSRALIEGGYYNRARFATGANVRVAATNNTLVSIAFLRGVGEPRLNEAFSVSGGSDTEFFTRLREMGAVLVWDDRAEVSEEVDVDRATLKWALRRQRRVGNVGARVALPRDGRAKVFIGACARFGVGVLKTGISLVLGRGYRATDTGPLMRGLGMLDVLRGSWVQEYKRVSS